MIGTDPFDDGSIPDLDDIEGTTISLIKDLALKLGVEKSLINRIESIFRDADNVIQWTNDVMSLMEKIDSLYNSGQISFESLYVLESLVMKLLPEREGSYSNEEYDGYIIHCFEFDQAQMAEMAEAPFKAQPYTNWMIDHVMTIADGMGARLGKLVGRLKLSSDLHRMARQSLDEGLISMCVQIKSHSNEDILWALEFFDTVAGIWKDLAHGG